MQSQRYVGRKFMMHISTPGAPLWTRPRSCCSQWGKLVAINVPGQCRAGKPAAWGVPLVACRFISCPEMDCRICPAFVVACGRSYRVENVGKCLLGCELLMFDHARAISSAFGSSFGRLVSASVPACRLHADTKTAQIIGQPAAGCKSSGPPACMHMRSLSCDLRRWSPLAAGHCRAGVRYLGVRYLTFQASDAVETLIKFRYLRPGVGAMAGCDSHFLGSAQCIYGNV